MLILRLIAERILVKFNPFIRSENQVYSKAVLSLLVRRQPRKIKDIMSKDIVHIESGKSVRDAARLMTDRHVGCLIVTNNGQPVGIVTERDLVRKVLAEVFDASKVFVSDVMSTPLFSTPPDATLEKAAELMAKYRVRRLPVVENNKLLGIITATDLMKSLTHNQNKSLLNAITRGEDPTHGPYR